MEEDEDLRESIGRCIAIAAHAYEQAVNRELAQQGITWRQCQVLRIIADEGEMAQVDLAHRLCMDPATLVGVLDRMERDELIVRRDCRQDRRRKIVAPQPKAQAVWSQILQETEKVRARASRGLTDEQLNTMRTLLKSIQGNLARGAERSRRQAVSSP